MNRFFNFLSIAKKSKNLLEGYSKCDDYRNSTDIYLFVISNDLSDKSKSKFKKHCENKNIPYIEDFPKLNWEVLLDVKKLCCLEY